MEENKMKKKTKDGLSRKRAMSQNEKAERKNMHAEQIKNVSRQVILTPHRVQLRVTSTQHTAIVKSSICNGLSFALAFFHIVSCYPTSRGRPQRQCESSSNANQTNI